MELSPFHLPTDNSQSFDENVGCTEYTAVNSLDQGVIHSSSLPGYSRKSSKDTMRCHCNADIFVAQA